MARGSPGFSRLRLDPVYLASGNAGRRSCAHFQRLARSAWQTQEIDGRTEIFASACLTLTNHAPVRVVTLQKEHIERGLLLLVTNATQSLPSKHHPHLQSPLD